MTDESFLRGAHSEHSGCVCESVSAIWSVFRASPYTKSEAVCRITADELPREGQRRSDHCPRAWRTKPIATYATSNSGRNTAGVRAAVTKVDLAVRIDGVVPWLISASCLRLVPYWMVWATTALTPPTIASTRIKDIKSNRIAHVRRQPGILPRPSHNTGSGSRYLHWDARAARGQLTAQALMPRSTWRTMHQCLCGRGGPRPRYPGAARTAKRNKPQANAIPSPTP